MPEHISKLIRFLRFPLIVGVVFIHTNFSSLPEDSIFLAGGGNWLKYGLSEVLCGACVPLFFLFSGYLFYGKTDEFRLSLYGNNLLKRARTLLMPYLIWNTFVIICLYLQNILTGICNQRVGCMTDYSVTDYIWAYLDVTQQFSFEGASGSPACMPFWYLRDLIFLSILSPIFYYIVRYTKQFGILIFFLIYLLPYHLPHLTNTGIFFFGAGMCCRQNDVDFAAYCKRFAAIAAVVAIVCIAIEVWFYRFDLPVYRPTRRLYIPAIVMLIIAATSKYLEKSERKQDLILSESSYFIFLYHAIPTAMLCALVDQKLPHHDIIYLLSYFMIPLIIGGLGVLLYYFLNRYMPHVNLILTGKPVHKTAQANYK